MTTPRVTVPVEPTEAMLDAGTGFLNSDRYALARPAPVTAKSFWSAMLSAAPAPEDGAANDDRQPSELEIAIRELLWPYFESAKLGHFTHENDCSRAARQIAGALKPGFYLSRFLPALATREEAPAHEFVQSFSTAREGGCKVCGQDEEAHREAPAEAGERGVAGVIMDGLWPILGGNHMDAEVWNEIGEVVSSALRAQPPARSGKVTWHSSGEDEGPDVGLQLDLGHGRSLWLGEGQKPTGWQFSLVQGDDIIPVADVIDHEQARDLFDLIASAVQPPAREDAQPDAGARLAKAMWGVDLVPAANPAPDALRVAVAAYLTAVDDLETPVMSPSLGLHRKEVARQARGKLREALAALQAEQKGGA